MEHERRSGNASATITGRIDARTYDVASLRETHDNWDDLSKSEKLDAVRDTDPESTQTTHNITLTRFHEYLVDNLNPNDTDPEANVSATWLALGTDGATGTNLSDTDLNNRTYSETVTDHADNGTDLLCSTFVDSSEGNGNTFDELGLFSGDPSNLSNADVFMFNHSQFSAVTKDDSKTVVFDVTLQFDDA